MIESFRRRRVISLAGILAMIILPFLSTMSTMAYAGTADNEVMHIDRGIVLSGVARGGRVAFSEDAVRRQIVLGTWLPPAAGTTIPLPDRTMRTASELKAGENGWFESDLLEGGSYLDTMVALREDRTFLLVAQGHNLVYVNGEPHMGDPYAFGYLRIPVRLHKGENHLLFSCSRGRLRAELQPVSSAVMLNGDDATLPDLREQEMPDYDAALHVLNTSETVQKGLRLRATLGNKTTETRLPDLLPLSVIKAGFHFKGEKPLPGKPQELRISVVLASGEMVGEPLVLSLRVRRTHETYKRTFVSGIDGSVQYYAVYPAQTSSPENALILTLHGASVEAIGQADAYGPKTWATLVAPTNRRPYGFDWEDWGRLDALEVLDRAAAAFPHDPARVILTGHSMGGHGTWSIGTLFPDHFAVIGPSAGWISFSSYAGGTRGSRPDRTAPAPAVALLERAATVSDTLLFADNLLQEKIYILHGDADDNVPVEQARTMRTELEKRNHPAVFWHEQKGAGHWWDVSDAPGADCVDWKPMFDLFESSRIPGSQAVDSFKFTTPTPAVNAACQWIRIEQQIKPLMPSTVTLNWEKISGVLRGTTENLAFLTIFPQKMGEGGRLKQVILDGQTLPIAPSKGKPVYLKRLAGNWSITRSGVPAREKRPERSGPLKMAFQNRFALVYGTQGTPEENALMLAHARFDAETFLYRGNGSPEIMPDSAYDDRAMRNRNVIVYGNATINAVWDRLLKDAPVRTERGMVRVGENERRGDDMMCLFVYPKPGSDQAMVGAIGGTGTVGLRLAQRTPYFVSGVAYPDWVIANPGVLSKGNEGVMGTGYFGNDWRLSSEESAWQSAP